MRAGGEDPGFACVEWPVLGFHSESPCDSSDEHEQNIEAATEMSARPMRRGVPRLAFNQQEAAEALGISVDHFERHIKPDLPVVYSGSRRLYPRTALERWLEKQAFRGGRRVA